MGRLWLLAFSAGWILSATNKGVKDIDIIVKKRPTGHALAVRTDGGGAVRFSLSEPGEYEIEFRAGDASPKTPPERGFAVAVSGEVRLRRAITKTGSTGGFATAETIALGRMTLDANTERVRLAHPRIDLANGIHTERITTFGPVDVMLRVTGDVPDPAVPAVNGLPRRLEFVAVEGGPSPARQPVSVNSDTGADWQIQFAPIDRISASFSKPGGRLAPGASDTVDVTVLGVGLAPGVYKGQISILSASGGQLGEPAFIPLYLRVLPRTQVLDPVVSRRTLVFADGADTQSLEVTNPNAVAQNYLLEAADATAARAVRITPAQLALQPGQSGRINVSFVGEALGPFTLRLTPQGRASVNIFARKVPPTRAGCLATELIPVLASVDPQIGEDATGTVEVYDNCGRRVRDVVVKGESESGASFFGINDGIGDIKVGLGRCPPKCASSAYARDALGGEITGSTGELTLGGSPLPALADADKPFEIVEVADATTGEPGVIAPGAQFTPRVITKSSSNIKNNFPVPVKELRGQTVSIGDRLLDIIGETEDGDPVVEVPTDLGPQFTTSIQSTKSGIKSQPRSIAIGPSSPALLLRANPDGTPGTQTPVYKMNGEVREDYALGGGAPPKAGEIIELDATGLGTTDADGNVLGAVKVLIGGIEAKVLSARKKTPPVPGYTISAEMPEVTSLDGGVSPATIKIVVDDIESAEAISPPVDQVQTTKVKLRTFCTLWDCSVKVDGVEYVGGTKTALEFEKGTEVSIEAPLTYFLKVIPMGRTRGDFFQWTGTTEASNQFKTTLEAHTHVTAHYRLTREIKAVTGAVSISPASPDGFYRDGATITVNATCPSGQTLTGISAVYTRDFASAVSETIPSADLPKTLYVWAVADFHAICAANVNLTVTTNPAGLGVRIGTTGNFTPGPITQQVPANQTATIATQTPQTLNGTGYAFTNWSTGGSTPVTTVQPASNFTATANFSVACHVLTINASGGTVTANPLGSVTGFQNNCYAPGTTVTLTATPNSGNAFNGWSGDASGNTSPTSVTMTGPKSVTANFGAPGNVTLTVTTNPVGLGVRIGTSSAFAPGPISQQIPANQSTTVEAVGTQVLNGTGYRFANWSTGGATAATTVQPSSNFTATANYAVACHTLTVNATGAGTVAVSPQSNIAGFPNNCYAPGTTVVLTANPNTGNAFTSWSGDATGSTSPTSITMDAPKTVTAAFGQQQNVTLNLITNPAGLLVQIGNGAFNPAPFSQQVPANQPQTIGTQAQQLRNNAGYSFTGWSTGATTPVTTVTPAANLAATANFSLACYVLGINVTGGGTVTPSPAAGVTGFPNTCYAPGTVVTLTASPNTGNQFTGWSGDATGTASPTTVTMNAPKTVNAAFGAPTNVTLTVTTNPVGLNVRIGTAGGFTTGPISQQVPANSTQTIAVDSPQEVNGIGYRFIGWSTGGPTPVTTVQPSSNFTATANFQVACYIVNVTGTANGTVALNPASGGVSGFPSNCFAPGSQVRILATANTGFGLRDVAINIGGTPSTVTTPNTLITVSGPTVAQATFIPRPATISTIFPPVLVSGTTYRDNVFFSNPTPTPGNSLQITGVTFQTTAGSGTVTLQSSLPIVFGALPANGQSSTQQILFNIPATVTGYNIFVTVEVKNANGDTFTNVVSVGQTK